MELDVLKIRAVTWANNLMITLTGLLREMLANLPSHLDDYCRVDVLKESKN
jgi:hypothetical protein